MARLPIPRGKSLWATLAAAVAAALWAWATNADLTFVERVRLEPGQSRVLECAERDNLPEVGGCLLIASPAGGAVLYRIEGQIYVPVSAPAEESPPRLQPVKKPPTAGSAHVECRAFRDVQLQQVVYICSESWPGPRDERTTFYGTLTWGQEV